MRLILLHLLLCALVPFAVFSSWTCATYYTVVKGDTCVSIKNANGISLDLLGLLNPGLNCYALKKGKQLCIAIGNVSIGATDVAATDAEETNESTNGLGTTNAGNNAEATNSIPKDCSKSYTVVSGDICWNIAANHGLNLSLLQRYNPGINCANLQVGQQVCLAVNAN